MFSVILTRDRQNILFFPESEMEGNNGQCVLLLGPRRVVESDLSWLHLLILDLVPTVVFYRKTRELYMVMIYNLECETLEY